MAMIQGIKNLIRSVMEIGPKSVAEATTFAAVQDGLRRRLAIDDPKERGLSVRETAYLVGFADPAAFSRAIKRWAGRSPRDARSAR